MHVHLPKPLHGWREFAGEVGIIVLGVLIALAAEATVENWQWRHKVDVVRKSLMGELGNDRSLGPGHLEMRFGRSRSAGSPGTGFRIFNCSAARTVGTLAQLVLDALVELDAGHG